MKARGYQVVTALLVLWLAGSAWAVDTAWTGAAGDGLWITPGNWSNGVPPTGPTATGNINIGYVAAAPVITIRSTDVIDCGSETVRPTDMHGPNWGATLNIDGGILTHRGFVMAPVADAAQPSVINLTNGAELNVVNLLLGDNWWFWTSPHVIINVYDNSLVNVSDWLWLGGQLNLYSGTIDIAGNFNMDTHAMGAAKLDIHGGTIIVRGADITANVADWIANGYLLAYGTTPGQRGGGEVHVDTTTIAGGTIITASPSLAAANPDPQPLNPTGSVGTLISNSEVELTLNWDAGPDPNELTGYPFNPAILTHYVWLSAGGEEADPILYLEATVPQAGGATGPGNSYGPITLAENTVYYWSVEEGVDNGTGNPYPSGDPNNILGPIWSFHTKAATPTILTPPADAIAAPNASFTVVADEVATAYQWYKVGAPDIALADGGPYSGTTTATLTVTNATPAEEGQYYCQAINGPNSANSEPAYLWTPRLIGHWKLDGDLLDSATPAHDATMAGSGPGTADYATGINGSAMEFFNDGDYVEIADADYFNFYPLGFTVSFWYKEKSAAGWRLPISKLDIGAAGWLVGIDTATRDWAVALFETENDAAFWADGDAGIDLGDGQWHLVTVTYDPAATNLTVYTDGDENENVTVDITDPAAHPVPAAPLTIGGLGADALDGYLDDIRIYSKVLTPTEVADLYVQFRPAEWVCVEDPLNPVTPLDFDGDCQVTLADLAEIAAHWLECQRYPAEACD